MSDSPSLHTIMSSFRLPQASGGGAERSEAEGVLYFLFLSNGKDSEKTPSVCYTDTSPNLENMSPQARPNPFSDLHNSYKH